MKSQIKRFSKSTLSVILSLCMLVSCMTVGIIATDAAQYNQHWQAKELYFVVPDSWDLSTYSHVQVDITRSTSVSTSTYQTFSGDMNRIGTSRLYYIALDIDHSTWKQNEYIAFTANSSTYGNGDFNVNANHYYTTPKDYGVNNSSNYFVAVPDSDENGCTVSIDWNANRDTLMKKTQTANVRTNKASSTTGGSVSIAGYYFTSDTAIATSSSSPSYDSVFGTTTTMTATANTGYEFDGWYSDSSCTTKLSSDATYSYTVLGAKTVYANFNTKLDPAASAVSLEKTSPASGTIYEVATSVVYTATATTPVSGVTYNFKVDGTSVQNTSSNTCTVAFDSSGTKKVTVTVEKDGYKSVTSSEVSTTVTALPTVYFNYNNAETDNPTMTYDATASAAKSNHIVYKLDRTWKGSSTYDIMVYDGADRFKTSSGTNITDNVPLSGNGYETQSTGSDWVVLKTNTSMTSSQTGKYTFYWDYNDKRLYVEYPHVVTFNRNGHGTAPEAQIINYNNKATKPDTLTEIGWTHDGKWYTTNGCTTEFNFNTAITANTTVYAKWTQNDHTISYPSTTTGYTLGGSMPTSAHYGETISFTVTPLTGYRIKSVKYNDGSDHPLTGSNNSYSFSMPDNDVTVSVETVQTYTVTFSKGTGVGNVTYKINEGESTSYSAPFTVDNNSTVVFTVAYNNGYEYNSVTDATASNNGKTLTVSSITSDKNVSLTAKKSTYNLVGACSPTQGGTVTFYKTYANAVAGTNPITTAQMDDEVYAKYTAASEYYTINTSNRFSKSGAGLSDLTLQENTNIVKFTMGYAQATITANVIAATPTFGACPDMDAYIGESFTYTGANLATLPNSTLSYTFNNETNNTGTFTPPAQEGEYTLTITASNKPDGISTAATATKNVTITVKYHEKSVTYYVDMHNNNMEGKDVEVAVVTNGGGTTLMKANSFGKLSQQSSSTVYSKAINTPATKINSTTYNGIYLRIRYGTEQAYNEKTIYIDLDDATALMTASSPEVWIEAQNEEGNTFKVTYASNTTTAVASGKKRIYVAKPYAWQDNDASWKHIHLYHWGNYTDIGWNSAPLMNHIGYDSEYHYYYVDVDSSVSNIIFQGWKDGSTTPDAKTGNIENIGSSNFFVLSKDGDSYSGTKGDNATVPGYTRYVSRVDMNIGETANIAPTHTGARVTYNIDQQDSDFISISDDGIITANSSTYGRDDISITVKVFGSVGAKATSANPGDYMTYTCKVSVRNPGVLNNYKIMSFAHQEYTVKIDNISGTQPGYFDLSKTSAMVNGLYNGSTYTLSYANSAIIVSSKTVDDSVVGTVTTEFTVKYAASNSSKGYSNITINNATIVTKSIKHQGEKRYGFKEWDPVQSVATKTAVIEDGVETVTHKGIAFINSTSTYEAVFEYYDYVDVNFTFNYWEYKPKVDADGMINYPYDATWAGNEDRSSDKFEASHTQKTYTVSNFEIRKLEKGDIFDKTIENIDPDKLALLVDGAVQAMGVKPDNNYYDYQITANTIPLNKISEVKDEENKVNEYAVNVTVNMTHSVKTYKVYLDGEPIKDSDNQVREFSYQEYAELSGQASNALWYAVSKTSTTINDVTDPLLATGSSYKFRVKGDTYLSIKTGTVPDGNDFNRSEVDFSHYEVIHRDNPTTTQVELVEYLLQNFYIADFFSPANVLDPQSYTGKGKFGVAYKVEEVTASTTASSGNITVYFTDSLDWDNICIYYWGENINNINWPGLAMTQYGIDEDDKKIYSAEIPGTAEGVIFTGNNNQTVDITNNIANGSHWKSKSETVQNGIPYDDAKFVGGGVVYFSVDEQGNPRSSNAKDLGYVNSDGTLNKDAVKEMLKSEILASVNEGNYGKYTVEEDGQTVQKSVSYESLENAIGTEDALKVAYGTEIEAHQYVENSIKSGVLYRYLPLETFSNDSEKWSNGVPVKDENGNYYTTLNNNTFRYSNTLQSYQYVYASGNENKETNAGKNMRLYSYYVYSYVAYNQETNVPETKYEIVLSDNYSDASTYWNGNTGN